MILKNLKTVWPSGLRRWLQAPVRKGVGSNPTAVIDIFGDSSFEIEVTLRPCPLYGELHVCETSQLRVPDVNLKLRIESEPLWESICHQQGFDNTRTIFASG